MTTVEAMQDPDYLRDAKQRERNHAVEYWLQRYPELDRSMIDMALTMDEVWKERYGNDYSAPELINQFLEEDQKQDADQPDRESGPAEGADPPAGEQRGSPQRKA